MVGRATHPVPRSHHWRLRNTGGLRQAHLRVQGSKWWTRLAVSDHNHRIRWPPCLSSNGLKGPLREASSRGERCIFLPKQGQVFQSIGEAYEFFNMYSWEEGFGIRGRMMQRSDYWASLRHALCLRFAADETTRSPQYRMWEWEMGSCTAPHVISLLSSAVTV